MAQSFNLFLLAFFLTPKVPLCLKNLACVSGSRLGHASTDTRMVPFPPRNIDYSYFRIG